MQRCRGRGRRRVVPPDHLGLPARRLTHLALNMLALWFVGGAVEPRLGRWRYLDRLPAQRARRVGAVVRRGLAAADLGRGVRCGVRALRCAVRADRCGCGSTSVGSSRSSLINVVIGFVPGLQHQLASAPRRADRRAPCSPPPWSTRRSAAGWRCRSERRCWWCVVCAVSRSPGATRSTRCVDGGSMLSDLPRRSSP